MDDVQELSSVLDFCHPNFELRGMLFYDKLFIVPLILN